MVVARGVGRVYGGRPVLAGVDLDVDAGEVVGLIGPNGGGKTTLLMLLAGLVRPTTGTVVIDGVAASDLAVRAAGAVGLITAEAGLYPLLTGRENLAFFAGLYGRVVDGVALGLLSELDVDETLLDTPSADYSSGVRQKVSLVRALALGPRVLLLDEPTSHLDPLSSRSIHRMVRAQADRGVAVVLATHDLYAAERVCDRVCAVDGGIVGALALDGTRPEAAEPRLLALYARAGAGR